MLIDRVGTYLGYASSHGVDTSSGGFPQLILQCDATHYYDVDVEDYVEIEPQELRAFLVLYGKDQKPLRNCEQAKKVFEWDGLSFQALAEMDLSETRFLFRVEENHYDGNTTLQVSWIDVETASPTRQISSLDTKGLQDLDAKFGLAKVAKKTDTKKPTSKPIPPKTSTKKTSKPKTPKAPAPKEEKEEKTGSTTREDAWKYVSEQIPVAALSEDDRAVAWSRAIEKIHSGPDDDTLTGEEWFQVQELIVSETIPF
ncbi:hypothetical protein LCGC14_1560030 [marine sediment metagenome]|uniref:Uncharacterized protein n=1 Tax=marine sediment metagenome TaxID=412755 RepID=A0A0F9J8S8_9ZZZZ